MSNDIYIDCPVCGAINTVQASEEKADGSISLICVKCGQPFAIVSAPPLPMLPVVPVYDQDQPQTSPLIPDGTDVEDDKMEEGISGETQD